MKPLYTREYLRKEHTVCSSSRDLVHDAFVSHGIFVRSYKKMKLVTEHSNNL